MRVLAASEEMITQEEAPLFLKDQLLVAAARPPRPVERSTYLVAATSINTI